MATLQSYLLETRRLLHDSAGKYWTDAALTSAINQASRRVVADSACLRRIQTIYLNPGTEVYVPGAVTGALVVAGGSGYVSVPTVAFGPPDTGSDVATGIAQIAGGSVSQVVVTHAGSGYLGQPAVAIGNPPAGGTQATALASALTGSFFDVMNVTVLWGQTRTILNRIPFTGLQATLRGWVGYQQQPTTWTSYGQAQWFIGPVPDQTYASEWDTLITPTDLALMTDVSPINYPYNDTVQFYAAHLAKFQEQSYADADKFLDLYQRKMQHAIRSSMMRMLPSAYGS